MKYYELYVDIYYMNDNAKVTITELEVIKETPKQIQVKGSKRYRDIINKSELGKINQTSSISRTIWFAEGGLLEALKKMEAHITEEINYAQKKLDSYNSALKGVMREIGKQI